MSQENKQKKEIQTVQTKKYIRGAYLFTTSDGSGYVENGPKQQDEVMITDKGMFGQLKRQIQEKKDEIHKRKQKTKGIKDTLIAIRQTPIQPLPENINTHNKCERATQQQFEYFQTFISQKEKQKKFDQEQAIQIQSFERLQQRYRQNLQQQDRTGVSLVVERQQAIQIKPKKKGSRVIIKKITPKQIKETTTNVNSNNQSQKVKKSLESTAAVDMKRQFSSSYQNQKDGQEKDTLSKIRLVEGN